MGFLKQLKETVCPRKFETFKNPLFIGPHPDDIEFGCGGTISKFKKLGIKTRFIVVTDGAAGSDDPSVTPEMLKDIRYAEAKKSADFLGAASIDFIGLPDSGYYTDEDVLRKVAPFILKYKPDIIFVPDPKLYTESHRDHITVANGVTYATLLVHYPTGLIRHEVDITGVTEFPNNIHLAYYFTDKPNAVCKFKKDDLNNKINALKFHESQFKHESDKLLLTYFSFKAKLNGIKHFASHAEEFKVLVPATQHVYSEGLKKQM